MWSRGLVPDRLRWRDGVRRAAAGNTRSGRSLELRATTHAVGAHRFVARFRRECRIVTSLEHPHIVPIHDFGTVDGTLYIDMRLLNGADLSERLERGPLDAAVAVDVIGQVAGALDAAHDSGVLHRDVKPSNIVLTGSPAEPFAYLVDFGIAAAEGATSLTAEAKVVGSLPYLPPERFGGGPIDARSDIYALACVLYECLTGRPPFPQTDPVALLYAHTRQQPVPASTLVPGLPPAVDAVLSTGLAKDPAQRHARATDLARQARTAVLGRPPGPRAGSGATAFVPDSPYRAGTLPYPADAPPGRPEPGAPARDRTERLPAAGPHRRRWFLPAVAAVVLLIAGAAAWLVLGNGSGTPTASSSSSTGARSGQPSSPPAPSSTPSSSAPASSSGAPAPAVAIGQCVSSARALVPCDATHQYEVFSTQPPCTADGMLGYLGGRPGTDTLLHRQPVTLDLGGSAVCAVPAPTAAGVARSVHDILASSAGDAWRLCDDDGNSVACNVPHTSEYVYVGPAEPVVNCTAAASAYMNIAFANDASQLQVQSLPSTTSQVCVVIVRGGDVLTASVHDIGTENLPLRPS